MTTAMEMEPRLQEKAMVIITWTCIPLLKRLIVILRITRAYIFESKNVMDPSVRLRDRKTVTYVYIFPCKVKTNPSRVLSNVKLT